MNFGSSLNNGNFDISCHRIFMTPTIKRQGRKCSKDLKTLLKKCLLSKADVHLALLDHRNTPTDQTGTSPSQRLFERRTRTLLPLSAELLKPESHHHVTAKLHNSQSKHAEYYNKMAKPLKPLHPGDTIRMKLPGEEQWFLGACKRQVDTWLNAKEESIVATDGNYKAHQRTYTNPMTVTLRHLFRGQMKTTKGQIVK